MKYETIIYDVSDDIATITLNRPDRLNAVTPQMEKELFDAMGRAEEADDVRVIVLTGEGRGFCSGADLEWLGELATSDLSKVDRGEMLAKIVSTHPRDDAPSDFFQGYTYFAAITKPVIAAINGSAVGLGFVIPLFCDIRIASDQAVFGTAFAQRGLIAEWGVGWILPRLVGLSNALDLLYSARKIDAEEACRMGLVSRVVPNDMLIEEVRQYATLLATKVSPRSLRVMKRQVYTSLFKSLGEAVDEANEEMLDSFQCDDFKEGVAYFLEQREPRFTGK